MKTRLGNKNHLLFKFYFAERLFLLQCVTNYGTNTLITMKLYRINFLMESSKIPQRLDKYRSTFLLSKLTTANEM